MRKTRLSLLALIFGWILAPGCKRATEEITSEPLSDYMPLEVGKYITYRLDSTVFTSFGTNVEIHSYQEKNVVDAQFKDLLDRPSYRVLRYLRDAAGTGPWTQAGSYYITPAGQTMEVIEHNLRFVKLALPIKKDHEWKGNHYLPNEFFTSLYSFTNDFDISDWDYKYDSLGQTLDINGLTVQNVIKVSAVDNFHYLDTADINDTKFKIPAGMTDIYMRGSAPDTIRLTTDVPQPNAKLFLYNWTNQPAILNNIVIPSLGGKQFEYLNGNWTYGYIDNNNTRKDSIYPYLPFGFRNYSVDKYAKHIGMVYQELIMWDFQADINVPSGGKRNGFGVKRSLIDHN